MAEAKAQRLMVATDVFPLEPVAPSDPIRHLPNFLFSPHRAAAVSGGRHLIGDLILNDVASIVAGRPERKLSVAKPDLINVLAGVGDAARVADMAVKRS